MRRVLIVIGMLLLALRPAAAQKATPEQVQAFGMRTMSLMLAVDYARRCPGLDVYERVIADEIWKIDIANLRRIAPQVDAQMPALRAKYGGRPCADAEAVAARKNGNDHVIVVTSAAARVIAELPSCAPIPYLEIAKPWAVARKTPAALEGAAAAMAQPLRAWAKANCTSGVSGEPALNAARDAHRQIAELQAHGFERCLPVGAFLHTDPVCAWKAPVGDGVVAGKVCDFTTGVFDRNNCVFGFDAAGNLLLSYVTKTDSTGKDTIDRVGFAIGGQRFDTVDKKAMAGGRYSWRFPASAASALLAAPREAEIDAEGFIGDYRVHSNTPHPAADWQDAAILAKAL